jgi:hypothetical protein
LLRPPPVDAAEDLVERGLSLLLAPLLGASPAVAGEECLSATAYHGPEKTGLEAFLSVGNKLGR